jgi:hypothetical protein
MLLHAFTTPQGLLMVVRRSGVPKRSRNRRYTISLCDHIAGEFVPYKQIDIIAKDDDNAIQKADEWVASIPELVEEETWLIIKQEARSVRPKKVK